jgi:hypothetical protein
MSEASLPLLNIYEVEIEGGTRHLVGFLDPVLAGAVGIDSRSMVGEFDPGPDGEFNVASFRPNPEFIAALTDYMNQSTIHAPEVIAHAQAQPGGWLYLIDPRNPNVSDETLPAKDLVGCFTVGDDGRIVPDSFRYNRQHLWFDPELGVSGLLEDRRFYDWLHPVEAKKT